MKKIIIIILALFICAPISLAAFFFMDYQRTINLPNDTRAEEVKVIIEEGSGLRAIAKTLKQKGVILDENYFYIYGRLNNKSNVVLAGKFIIPMDKTIPEVYSLLSKPIVEEIRVSIPEGLRADEIADLLEEKFENSVSKEINFSRSEFEKKAYASPTRYSNQFPFLKGAKNLEGFLFPDTYNFYADVSTDELIITLLQNFNDKVYSKSKNTTNSTYPTGFTYYDILTLASIVEREGRTENEKYEIANILLSRLNGNLAEGRLLQADATILYDRKTWVFDGDLDKGSDSPYNSYKKEGLPPTPICNPGVEAVLAVVEAEPTEYLYYLHKSGRFLKGRTYQEHLNNLYN